MSIKFLHLCHDDKFIQFVQDSFESALPDCNRYILWGDKDTHRLPGHAKAAPNTRFVGYKYLFSTDCIDDLAWCDAVIVHCMTPWAAFVALKSSIKHVVIWSGWGFDYYDLIQLPNNGILEKTYHLNEELERNKKIEKTNKILIQGLERRGWNWIYQKFLKKKIISRVTLFSSPIPEDWELLSNACDEFKTEYVQLNYGSVDSMFRIGPDRVYGRNILIGNSASTTNNHIEAFDIIRGLDLEGRKIIVPLSYGDIRYSTKVKELGEQMFGDKFYPLVDFMSIKQYNDIISSCSTVIMNHVRQQALGNVNIMLYKGAKVFLNKENPIYKFFNDKKAFVFSITEISKENNSVFEPLTENAVSKNRSIIDNYWSTDAVNENILRLSEIVIDKRMQLVHFK